MSAPTGRRRADDKLILALAGGETVEAAAAKEAVNTLLDLQSKDCPPPTRLGAAKSILEIGNRLRTEVDLAGRLQALERALGLMPPTATGGQ